jgi:hypothetical protein
MSEWISVKDRLPLSPTGTSEKVYETVDVLVTDGKYVCSAEFQAGRTWADWCKYDDIPGCDVTHWMPLPELPKDES